MESPGGDSGEPHPSRARFLTTFDEVYRMSNAPTLDGGGVVCFFRPIASGIPPGSTLRGIFTAPVPRGLGGESMLSLSEIRLIRRAIRNDWPVRPAVRRRLVAEVGAVFDESDPSTRRILAAARCFLAMDAANLRHLRAALREAGVAGGVSFRAGG